MKGIFFKLNSIFDKSEKSKLYFYLIFSFFTPVIEVMGIGSLIVFIVFFFNKLEAGENFYLEKLGFAKDNLVFLDSIESVLFVVIIIFCFRCIYLFFFHYFETNLRNTLVGSKSKTAYQKFMNFSYLEMKNSSKSEVFNLAVLEAARVIDFVMGIVCILREIILVIILSVSLFILNPKLTLILCLFLLVLSFIFLFIYGEKLYFVGEELRRIQKELLNLVNESVSSFKMIRLLNKENFFLGNFNQITDIRKKNIFYQQFIKKIPKLAFETLVIVLISLIVIIFNTDNNISETLSFLTILGLISSRLVPSFSTLNVLYSTVKFNEASVDNFFNKVYQSKEKSIKNYESKIFANSLEYINTINIKNLTFSYNNNKILDKVNLKINKGKIFGIFGRSGSGKSTLIDIIAGLIEPDNGEVLFNDNKKINDNISEWQSLIGYVPQEPLLLNDTIKNNICLGVQEKDINLEKLENLLNLIKINEFSRSNIFEGDTKIGEGGSKISGGQKQFVAIARTLYFNRKILIFDEATSSLDRESEKKILNLILKLKKDHIVIIISHNEKIKKICDEFIDLDNIGNLSD